MELNNSRHWLLKANFSNLNPLWPLPQNGAYIANPPLWTLLSPNDPEAPRSTQHLTL